MRLAVGPFAYSSLNVPVVDLPGVEVRRVGPDRADVPFDYETDDFDSVWARLPTGWKPDLFIWWTPEYRPYPFGLERCPCPTVAIVSDWGLNFVSLRAALGVFDRIYIDRGGVDLFRRFGYDQTEYWPPYSFNPRLHRRLTADQSHDITFIGSFNHHVEHERAFWLRRLARLADRYDVSILTGLHGEEYVRFLNASKIVFNFGARGEMNLRAYEAPACGALLFMERGNLEIGEYLRDGEECVLYGDDLEDLVARYLADDAARERIAQAGFERIQRERPADHWRRLIDDLQARPPSRGRRAWAALSPGERRFRYGLLAMSGAEPRAFPAAVRALQEAMALGYPAVRVLNALGVLYGHEGIARSGESRQEPLLAASRWLTMAFRIEQHPVICRNLGAIAAELGDASAAERLLGIAARALRSPDAMGANVTDWAVHHPHVYDRFRVEWERIAGMDSTDDAQRLLGWKTNDQLGDLAGIAGLKGIARHRYEEAMSFRPDLPPTPRKLAKLLSDLGDKERAVEAYRLAVEHGPFDFESLAGLAGLLLELGQVGECRRVCAEARTLIRACPNYGPQARTFDELERLCETRASPVPDP